MKLTAELPFPLNRDGLKTTATKIAAIGTPAGESLDDFVDALHELVNATGDYTRYRIAVENGVLRDSDGELAHKMWDLNRGQVATIAAHVLAAYMLKGGGT